MNTDIKEYNKSQPEPDQSICTTLTQMIDTYLPQAESKIWHGSPVWFLNGNPIVGYAKRKNDVQLLFWSGQSFGEEGLAKEGTFKAAQKRYTSVDQIVENDLTRWLHKAQKVQWDYKNIVKRKGVLEKLTDF